MGLDGKKIFIEALNGFFLKYKVNPASSIQHPHFDLCLLSLLSWLRGLCFFTHAYQDRGKYFKVLQQNSYFTAAMTFITKSCTYDFRKMDLEVLNSNFRFTTNIKRHPF